MNSNYYYLTKHAIPRITQCLGLYGALLLSLMVFPLHSKANGQQKLQAPVTLELKEVTLKEALKEIERQTGYNFVINDSRLREVTRVVSVNIKENNIARILDLILEGTNITYYIKKNQITLIPPPDGKKLIPLADSGGGGYSVLNFKEYNIDLHTLFAPYPQNIVKGKVTDEVNVALPGVNVLVKGSTTGTVTDANGDYSITSHNDNDVLIFSFIGYGTQEIPINGQATVNVQMKPDAVTLGEVVVVGYGTIKKSDLTGAVGQVKAETLQERPAASLNQTLAGRIPGVWVNTNSGRPGGQTRVNIRGYSSINTSNNPLYVIDGVILPVGTQTAQGNAIDYLNPNDIASVEVLKDASAAAIYGARGANGVILITTKRGTPGGRISYDSDYSINKPGPQRVKMLNAREWLAVEEQAYINTRDKYDPAGYAAGKYRNPTDVRSALTPGKAGAYALFDDNLNPLYDTDWFKESVQEKLSQNHQLSFTGGNNETTFGVFLGYRNENGLLLNSYLKRYSGRLTFDSQVKKWIKVGGSLGYNNQEENIVDQGTGGLNTVREITEALPFMPVKFPDGTWGDNLSAFYPAIVGIEKASNPVHILNDRKFLLNSQTALGSVYSNITFLPGLDLRTIVAANVLTQGNNQYNGRTLYGIADGQFGTAFLGNRRESFWSFENYLTYSKRFADIHAINAMLGVSWQETNAFAFNVGVQNFTSDYFGFNNIGAGSSNPSWGSNRARWAYSSYFTRINYSLKDKYLVTFTARSDGSSKFGTNNKYAFFPSAALGWRISEEDFLRNNSTVSNLKLRASYGVTGNSEIPPYNSIATLNSTYRAVINGQAVNGTGTNRLANPDLKWEKTAAYDVGLEVGLFNNRVALEADYYYRKTTDMLLDAPVPRSSGYATIRKNIGSMENKGIELGLTTTNIETPNFSWTTFFNISMNRNKVLSLATPDDILGVGSPTFLGGTGIIRVGEPVGSFFGFVRLGTWNTDEAEQAELYGKKPGDLKYQDQLTLDTNGDGIPDAPDGVINNLDRVIIGNGSPKAWGSFSNTFRFKNFDVTVELQYSYGNDVWNMTNHSAEDRQGGANSYRTVLNAWTPANQNTPIAELRVQQAGYDTRADSHWIEDGSFVRGRNFLLGYTFPGASIQKLHLSRLRIYASVQNFFLNTNYTGNDPEVISQAYTNPFAQGVTFFDYPKPTVYMLGLNIGL